MTTQDRARQVSDELEAALEAAAAHTRVSRRLEHARAAAQAARRDVDRARDRLAAEVEEVQALESFSTTRIWATLRGRRDTDLDRERAEQQAAEYAVARAEASLRTASEEVRRAEAELAALGDVHGRRERALAAKEEWLTEAGGPAAEALARIAGELAQVRDQATEVREAREAGEHAAARLDEAAALLGKADDWATYDTFFGGGLLGDAMKYDRMDQAQRQLQQCDQALRVLSVELADTQVDGVVRGLSIDGLTRTFDVWFDNIFSDWSVKSRIGEAAQRTDEARRMVHDVRTRLGEAQRVLAERDAELAAERERLVQG